MNHTSRAHPNPALLRGLAQARRTGARRPGRLAPRPTAGLPAPAGLTRRRTLQVGGAAAAALALSACGVGGTQREAEADFWADKEQTGSVRFGNWPLYMDPDHGPLRQFTEETGIEVDYKEDVQEAASFFGQVQPRLANDDDTGYDLFVVPNGFELSRLIELGYLVELDHARLPNFEQYAGQYYKETDFDPGNVYTVPYQSGMTGIAYNPEFIDREITSIEDLFDPEFEGRVGMFADPQEIANFGLLATGVNPADSNEADWEAAAQRLTEQRDAGLVRAYYDQDFVQPLTNGDLWITMAWSGDIYQQNAEEGTNLRFVMPDEGATLWTDNMMIPFNSQAPVDAIELMDFLYNPEVAAGLTEYIAYIPPVPDVQQVLEDWSGEEDDGERAQALAEMAESQLVFPDEADFDRLHNFVTLETDEQDAFSTIFQAVTQS
ncbi:ABC transporter substrate-binding protein [Nocardiopsis nanhaiensis]